MNAGKDCCDAREIVALVVKRAARTRTAFIQRYDGALLVLVRGEDVATKWDELLMESSVTSLGGGRSSLESLPVCLKSWLYARTAKLGRRDWSADGLEDKRMLGKRVYTRLLVSRG